MFFVIFGVSLRHFHSEHCNYLFIKNYWRTNFFLLPFKTFQSTKCVETLTKMRKIFENWKSLGFFVIFGVNLRHFHSEHCNYIPIKDYWATNFPLLPFKTIQSTQSVETLTKCIKTFKIGKGWVFCPFRCQFETLSCRTL